MRIVGFAAEDAKLSELVCRDDSATLRFDPQK
jgi:hypothetical protein